MAASKVNLIDERDLEVERYNRLPPAKKALKPHASFKDHDVSLIHMDLKHLPNLQDRDRVSRKRFMYVAIDRSPCYVHLAVKDDETTASAVGFLTEALRTFPSKVTHLLTDYSSCFTADALEAARKRQGLQHRKGRPLTAEIAASSSAPTASFGGRC